MKLIKMILAADLNGAIGNAGIHALRWHIPEDLKRFKNLTNGHILIMGLNTYLSLPGVLPNRTIFVVSRNNFDKLPQETDVFYPCRRIEEAIKKAQLLDKEIFICGGAEVYNYCLERGLVDEIYLTQVNTVLDYPNLAKVDLERYLGEFTCWSVDTVNDVRFIFYEKNQSSNSLSCPSGSTQERVLL